MYKYREMTEADNDAVAALVRDNLKQFGLELKKLYLADSAKGSGLSYELIEFIEDKMREAGYKQSYLETHDNLQARINSYVCLSALT